MKPTLYLSLEETLALHVRLIERFGGTLGVRDKGLLQSALVRPQMGYYETLSEQAAALMQSLALNHAFVDGNKRVAFAATAIFLRLNGYRLVVDADNGEGFIVNELIKGRADLAAIAAWLEAHMKAA
jgi:death-on-curing protein